MPAHTEAHPGGEAEAEQLSLCAALMEGNGVSLRDAARLLWRHVLAFPHPPRSGEPQLLTDLQAAGVTEEAVKWLAELIGEPDRSAPERLRLRQALAWLVTADPALGDLVPDVAGPVARIPEPSGHPRRASA